MIDQRWATAVHETAHGLAYLLHNSKVHKVVIYDSPVDNTDGRLSGRLTGRVFVRPDPSLTPEQRALCNLAGPAAEYRFCGRHYAIAGRGDVLTAQDSLSGTGLRVRDVWPRAIRLVDFCRTPIQRVALRLHQKGELSGEELGARPDSGGSGAV